MASIVKPVVAVTGASGFIGSHIVNVLLQHGYHVRALVRDPSDETKVAHLRKLVVAGCPGTLQLMAGDLLKKGDYDKAFNGASAVIHTAAVVEIINVADAEKQIVAPAVEGTQNVMDSIDKSPSVRTLVYTSTVLAVQSFNKAEDHVFTESDWNDWSTIENGDPYGFAKTRAEQLLLERSKGKPYSVRVINPGVVLGPIFCKAHTKASTVLVREMLYRNPMHNYLCTFVDVRDVAMAHLEAMRRPNAHELRFILVGDERCMCTTDLGPIMEEACPEFLTEATPKYPGWKFHLYSALSRLSLGSLGISEFQRLAFTVAVNFSNARAKQVLGLKFRPLSETLRDSAMSMVEGGYVKPELRAGQEC